MTLTIETIAAMCYAANRELCLSQADKSPLAWWDTPEWVRAVSGVEFHIANPDVGPEASHEEWMRHKLDNGWRYGAFKNEATKEHPCFLPFAELPAEQQIKDYVFKAIVAATRNFLPETQPAETPPPPTGEAVEPKEPAAGAQTAADAG